MELHGTELCEAVATQAVLLYSVLSVEFIDYKKNVQLNPFCLL